jgi:hexosaminidase
VSADLLGIPTVPFKATSGKFDIASVRSIVVDSRYAAAKDEDGWTLIPPTLEEFASTFSEDLDGIVGCTTSVEQGDECSDHSIFLTIGNSSDFKDAAGRFTSEAYSLDVTAHGITITGASALGVWWGSRTLIQQAVLHSGRISRGSGSDSPGWGTRGVMLDGGRHYYPPDFIKEMCAWMSFWKQNTFHLHLSDNLYNNVDIYDRQRQLDLYARFRPYSDDPAVAGLNTHANESYTEDDFNDMQYSCAARGVTIIPEIEAPGHALVISQWKPELGLDGQLDLLNISFPETIPTVETIWKTFLPWFQSKAVHIGADEYADSSLSAYQLAESYNHFVNTMDSYIRGESGKEMRIWGTYPPQKNYTSQIHKDVTIQHWEFFEDNPLFDYVDNGYRMINSDDSCYIVQKYSTSYPNHLNRTLIFNGNPAGGAFAPYIFDPNNQTNNPAPDIPYVLGHIAAQWNDYGYNTSTYLEAYYSWRDLLPALADKQWGGNLQEGDYDALFDVLQPAAPGQNLDRAIISKGSTIVEYKFRPLPQPFGGSDSQTVKDLSGNGYDAKTNCSIVKGAVRFENGCSVETPLTSKGRDYTLSFNLRQTSETPGPLFTGPDSELRSGNGTSSQVMLVSGGNAFALNYSLPLGKWLDASLIGRGNRTFFSVNGGSELEFKTHIGVNGETLVWAPMSIVAPLQTIGGGTWEGRMRGVKLVDHA